MSRERFIGSWNLHRWIITSNGTSRHPFGEDAGGLLLYTDDGCMAVVINKPAVLAIPAGSPYRLPDTQKARLFDHCFAYAGQWRLEDNQVIHRIQQADNPHLIGSQQSRTFAFADNQLILSAMEEIAGKESRWHRLIWVRVAGRR